MNEQEQLDWLARNINEWPEKASLDVTIGWLTAASTQNGEPDYIKVTSACNAAGITKGQWQARRYELINKPSWDDAPEWAEYLAQDESGRWNFFRYKPEIYDSGWGHSAKYYDYVDSTKGEPLDWKNSLEKRPEKYTVKEEEFKPTHTITNIVNNKNVDCVINYQSDSLIVYFDGNSETVISADVASITPYKSPKQKQFDTILEKWKRQSLDYAHDNRNSTSTIGYVFDWFLDNYEVSEK